ncbi:NDP-hexose 2,3-dehydratase family protein [Streptomyces coeruleorubidus]|uniref:NDP-hexose 2,3-dehydratase family protein n=1 Tax=Streptomyces coeruleorubidus TaxID=116188 RepID=UPI0037B33221
MTSLSEENSLWKMSEPMALHPFPFMLHHGGSVVLSGVAECGAIIGGGRLRATPEMPVTAALRQSEARHRHPHPVACVPGNPIGRRAEGGGNTAMKSDHRFHQDTRRPSLSRSIAGSRWDPGLPERLALSAASRKGVHLQTPEVIDWIDEFIRAHTFQVDRIPFAKLDGWSFAEPTGNLVHHSGRFFTVEGLRVAVGDPVHREWCQPTISQPEVGILGILAKEFDGVLHFLLQAKMEPGNPNLVQLSPTVQATRSNYTKVHRGADVRYLEYFTQPGRCRVIADVLQSEHGSWFLGKFNRNMIIEALDEVPLLDGFCWLTLGQIAELLHRDNTVNMDARTVLSCVPHGDGEGRGLTPDTALMSWFTAERCTQQLRTERVPLGSLPDWTRDETSIRRADDRYFRVVAVSVRGDNREVSRWTQPLFEPVGTGVVAFLTHTFDGVPHVLAHARVEVGFRHTVELGPTVQCVPDNYAHPDGPDRPPYLDDVLTAPVSRIHYDTVHAEEGGRFLGAESRYLLVEADESQARRTPRPGYSWISAGQLTSLVGHSNYLNVQARSLLACLNATRLRELS